MKKTISVIVMLLLMLVLLTGCVNINYEVKVKRDGSGDISYVYGVSKDILEQYNISAEQIVGEMKGQAEESSYKVEEYEDENIAGFKASKHIDDLETDLSLQDAFGEDYVKDEESSGIYTKKDLFTVKYSQNAEIDLTSIEEIGLEIKYVVKLPVKAEKSNADEISENGKTLIWNLKSEELNKIEFTARGLNIITVLIIIVIILVIIAALIVFMIFKRKKAKNETK